MSRRDAGPVGPSAWTRAIIVECYRLTGAMPETATYVHAKSSATMFPGGIPADLLAECVAARASFDAERHAAEGLREVYGWGPGLGK
jgi:hypothetical protein